MKYLKRVLPCLLLIAIFCLACTQNVSEREEKPSGEQLAAIYCGSCHLYPEPALLPKSTWEAHVLPRMGYMMGIYPNSNIRESLIEEGMGGVLVNKAKIFPEKPILEQQDWMAIVEFYLSAAPERLDMPNLELKENLASFEVRFPNYALSPPSTTLLQFHENGLYLGDANSQRLYEFDAALNVTKAAKVKEGAVSIAKKSDALAITVMGSFSPTDAPSGFILQLPTNSKSSTKVLIDSLQRPVHTAYTDLNGDGLEDIVISEFAKWTGGLSWWAQGEQGEFKEHLLRNQPGAIKTAIQDFNGDGKPDILALFGQGNEGFWLYINEGGNQFKEQKVLQLESTMGSSSFRLIDYNGDGLKDILYTAGDNADYPPILKPYHGVYIYENKGDSQFEQAFFYPLAGAYGAIAEDFDLDGDLDIAAISFFPDFKNDPNGGFLYLEHIDKWKMKAYHLPQSSLGRWIVMDSGDIDRDGDIDLAIGSLAFEVIPDNGELAGWVNNALPFLLLENKQR
jgi:hypothetical protein